MPNEAGETDRLTKVPVAWRLVVAAALVEPLLVSSIGADAGARIDVTWPRVHAGDEPHYLAMLNSLVRDGDLDLANNYGAALAGDADAGRSFRGFPLDPHISWYEGDEIVYWWELFESNPPRWSRDEGGGFVAAPLDPASPPDSPEEQFSWHFPGLPMLLALMLVPFPDPEWLESMSLIVTALSVVVGAHLFEVLIRPYEPAGGRRGLVVAAVFLGTPIWHYARTLFTEPYQLTLAIAAYVAVLRYARYGCAGVLMGAGMLMKPNFILLAIPLAWHAWKTRDGRTRLLSLAFPVGIATAALLWLNMFMHGSPFRSPLEWRWGNPLEGAIGLTFDATHGLLPFAPVACASAAAWPRFLRSHPHEGRLLLLGSGLFFLCVSSYFTWEGGYCYGPRYVVPILPLLMAPLCVAPELRMFRGRWGLALLIGLGSASVLLNLVGAFACRAGWSRHPIAVIADWIAGSG